MIVSDDHLDYWTREADEYMNESGRKVFPFEVQDRLYERGARRCSRCKTVKRLEEFGCNRTARKGISGKCDPCVRLNNSESHHRHRESRLEYKKQRYHKNREQEITRARQYHFDNPWGRALGDGYRKAVAAGVPAEHITEAELLSWWKSQGIDPSRCIYTGEELVPFVNRSLDHGVPLSDPDTPGHVLSNLYPATNRVNTCKGNRRSVAYVLERTTA